MPLTCGIVGLPNVGKSTIFNAIASAKAEVSNYPFCTIHPNVGMVSVPDDRLNRIHDIVKSAKIIPSALEFFDIAGLVKGASKGEGLGNQFLSHIRNVDSLLHVVRCFEDENISACLRLDRPCPRYRDREPRAESSPTLKLSKKQLHKKQKEAKAADKKAQHEVELCKKLKAVLGA